MENLHQLFNHRYNAELPTGITVAEMLKDIDERLCTIHTITAPAFMGMKVKRKK